MQKLNQICSNDATKPDLKNIIGVHTSSFAKNTDLTNLKSDVDELDIDYQKMHQAI